MDRELYGVLPAPGEERGKLIESYVESGLKQPGMSLSDEPVIRRQATFLADKGKIERENTDITFGKKDFIYNFLSSMRQKINDPLGVRKKRREQWQWFINLQ